MFFPLVFLRDFTAKSRGKNCRRDDLFRKIWYTETGAYLRRLFCILFTLLAKEGTFYDLRLYI